MTQPNIFWVIAITQSYVILGTRDPDAPPAGGGAAARARLYYMGRYIVNLLLRK